MADIVHRVGIKSADPAATFGALTRLDGLAGWWTEDTRGDGAVGGQVRFTFGENGFFLMTILELQPGKLVRWEVADGPEEWIGTTVRFDLRQEDGYTIVLFTHAGWAEVVEFMHHCSTKWALFLMSLKAWVESGSGEPFPRDVKIDNWN